MKKFSKHTPEQIVAKLDKARSMKASGSTVAEVCRDLGVSEATYRRWVKQYGEMSRSEACRFKELQEENAKLTRLLGEAELEKALLKGACGGKILTPARKYEAIDYAVSVGYSVRFACRVVGVSRAAYYNARTRHQQPSVDKYAALRRWLVTFTGEHRRWGYRRAWVKAQASWFYLWP